MVLEYREPFTVDKWPLLFPINKTSSSYVQHLLAWLFPWLFTVTNCSSVVSEWISMFVTRLDTDWRYAYPNHLYDRLVDSGAFLPASVR